MVFEVPHQEDAMGKKNSVNLSIVDRDLKIDGSVLSKGKLIIKGALKGTIDGEIVIIAEEGDVSATATVQSMTIGGRFQGELTVSRELIILSTGSCHGKVRCKDLIVENGGILNADVSCITTEINQTSEDSSAITELNPAKRKKAEN